MKFPTSQFLKGIIYLFFFISSATLSAQVGINTTTPVEMLDVNGNLKLDGAFMPGNASGGVDQILLSQGTGVAPVWGPGFINTTQIDFIGKFYVYPVNIAGDPPGNPVTPVYTIITVNDPEMTATTVVTWHFTDALPTGGNLEYGNNLRAFVETLAGQVKFHFYNSSNQSLVNFEIQYVAFYNQ